MHQLNETHIDDLCPGCHKPHGSEWRDEWHGDSHYQVTSCKNCGLDDIFKKSEELSSGKFSDPMTQA